MGKKDDIRYRRAVGDALREARLRAGYDSLTAAADAVDTSVASLSRYESGHRTPTLGSFYSLAGAYETSVADFFPDQNQIDKASEIVSGGKEG